MTLWQQHPADDKQSPAFTDHVAELKDAETRDWIVKATIGSAVALVVVIISVAVASVFVTKVPLAEINLFLLVALTPTTSFLGIVFKHYFPVDSSAEWTAVCQGA